MSSSEPISPGPTYEGRPLPRPDEEIVDQGLGFDVGTLVGRRQVLAAFGLGAAVAGLAACTSSSSPSSAASPSAPSSQPSSGSASSSGEIPDETAGPYPGDGTNGPDVLSQSGIVRSDIRSSFGSSSAVAGGVPITLALTVKNLTTGAPFAGAAVYVWHCDREGRYSLYSPGVTGENYLRGVQIADASGKVSFTSVFPACYTGRWPHIHFEVYPGQADITDASNAIATSQVALPESTCKAVYAESGYEQSVSNLSQVTLRSDMVFGDDGGVSQLGTVSGSVGDGYSVALAVGIDTTTTPSGGGFGGGPGGPPPGAPPA